MLICWDKERLKEVTVINFDKVEIGQSKDIVLYLYNPERCLIENVKIETNHPEVKVVSAPERMLPESMEVLRLRWSPTLANRNNTKCEIKTSGTEIYG